MRLKFWEVAGKPLSKCSVWKFPKNWFCFKEDHIILVTELVDVSALEAELWGFKSLLGYFKSKFSKTNTVLSKKNSDNFIYQDNLMPQIDKVTFLTIIYWTFALYFFLYLDLNVTYMYKFVTGMKLRLQRLNWVYRKMQVNNLYARILSSRNWI
jgi:hypothetical protein